MNPIEREIQIQTMSQQVKSFQSLGLNAYLKADVLKNPVTYSVLVANKSNGYRFSDPDYNIIIMQLAYFYGRIKGILTKKWN